VLLILVYIIPVLLLSVLFMLVFFQYSERFVRSVPGYAHV
jgi:hypothetical protein